MGSPLGTLRFSSRRLHGGRVPLGCEDVLVGDTLVTASGRAPNIPKSRTYLLLPYFHPSSQLQH